MKLDDMVDFEPKEILEAVKASKVEEPDDFWLALTVGLNAPTAYLLLNDFETEKGNINVIKLAKQMKNVFDYPKDRAKRVDMLMSVMLMRIKEM